MINQSFAGIIAELIIYSVMILILVRILFYVRKQARQVDEMRQEIDLINKAREKK